MVHAEHTLLMYIIASMTKQSSKMVLALFK